ncbi:MAG TPA: hypothetical protein VJZ00_14340 [Thermoanaerobaculia bacterium]|nr:hypothetical protein [Thermoanaerobaculia bacterium]
MKRFAILLLALLAACRNFESPTEPGRALNVRTNATDRYTLDPPSVVLKPGQSVTIAVHINPGVSTLGVVFDCDGPCSAAKIEGYIPQWSSDGTITITALQGGRERIRANSRNFGSPDHIEVIGEVRVDPDAARRRSVRH